MVRANLSIILLVEGTKFAIKTEVCEADVIQVWNFVRWFVVCGLDAKSSFSFPGKALFDGLLDVSCSFWLGNTGLN